MKDRNDLRSWLASGQKLRKRRKRTRRDRHRVDLAELHRDVSRARRIQVRQTRSGRAKGGVAAVMAVLVFLVLGYSIAALPAPIWVKVLLFAVVAVFGFVPSRFVAAIFY